MIQIIAGEKGKGKTKILLDKANAEVLTTTGTLAFIDKNNRHMYELNNKIRLISAKDYFVNNAKEFTGFIAGLISQDNDLSKVYLDGFLSIAPMENSDIAEMIEKLDTLSNAFDVDFVISISKNESDLPENAKPYVIVSL
ncbi:MAG: twitching motility protein PilT [Lachnospiraceae bacterium]|nr:twitching motility protein PilT [Lachnospiraceae bacterium]MBP3609087.1 twitching motility protein PilT [Lachnospiraceae bacterium]